MASVSLGWCRQLTTRGRKLLPTHTDAMGVGSIDTQNCCLKKPKFNRPVAYRPYEH
ncbi:MAG TPA: hypothetical protein VKB35_09780 [Ktedonobacteraceae bacterium]|nr:hypothetical protein [Ktedonobacteraceae bacterium]